MTAPGNRLPHRSIAGHAIYDLLGPWFTVIGGADAAAPLMSEAATRGIPIVHLGTADSSVVLVRPDQHIAWVSEGHPDWREVLDSAVRGFPGAWAATPAFQYS